ncbi:MAG TPA: hypothetical protein VMD58_00005 [Acidobacteriaceae bacterium]|nr:hypothetical protein [Acidobacteriaceae bacterium]
MNGFSLRDPEVICAITAAGLCVGGVIVWAVTRKRPTEEELERMRREQLVKTGRIMDGTILDTSELEDDGSGKSGLRLILYKYEIAGVTYECSQDVTHLKDYVNIHETRLSFPCSVRYEPRCPSNSIVVAETWSGLRDTANSVPIHPTHLAVRKARATPQLHG